jgi:fucose permease
MIHLLLVLIYLTFISLGLPDAVLGSAWPVMHQELNVSVSYAGILTFITCGFTIVSSLLSARLTKRFGTSLVVVVSVMLTAFGLLGYYFSTQFYMLAIFAIPYGFGAGGIDAALNNYVAVHFKAKHMSWLHAMWGVGATLGPYAMSFALTNNMPWNDGYLIIFILQCVLLFVLFFSLPLWKKNTNNTTEDKVKVLGFKELFSIRGLFAVLVMFFSYCALEQTAMLWASSYLISNNNVSTEVAAFFASMFCVGITVGRFINGFIATKLKDKDMIRLGLAIIFIGMVLLFINIHIVLTYVGFILIGLGCAPIYPSIIHSTPFYFGEDVSQSLIGIQMAVAYVGVLFMPPLFGLIADFIDIKILPIFLFAFLLLMIVCHEVLLKKIKK